MTCWFAPIVSCSEICRVSPSGYPTLRRLEGVTRCQTAFYKVKLQSKWDVSDLLIISPVQTALSSSNFCRMSPQSSTIKEPTA